MNVLYVTHSSLVSVVSLLLLTLTFLFTSVGVETTSAAYTIPNVTTVSMRYYTPSELRQFGPAVPRLLTILDTLIRLTQNQSCVSWNSEAPPSASSLCVNQALAQWHHPNSFVDFRSFVDPSESIQLYPKNSTIVPARLLSYPYVNGFNFVEVVERHFFGFRAIAGVYQHMVQKKVPSARKVPPYALVYWKLTNFRDRALQVLKPWLNALTGPIFLLCHNTDHVGFPAWLLAHARVLRIFSIHIPADLLSHPKLVPLPLGVFPNGVLVPRMLVAQRLEALQKKRNRKRVRNATSSPSPEKLLLMSGLSLTASIYAQRRQILRVVHRSIPNEPSSAHYSLYNYFSQMLNYRFVLCPRGNGMDTFRVYEALYMGRVPVVSELRPDLFEDLPVVYVKDWAQLNQTLLAEKWKEFSARKFDLNKRFLLWWLQFLLFVMVKCPPTQTSYDCLHQRLLSVS